MTFDITGREPVNSPRRHLLRAGLTLALAPGVNTHAQAQALPPLPTAKLLLGAPAGGAGDLMARRLADKLRGRYAASVIVENKPGAGGQLAAVALKEGVDDGSQLLLTPSSLLSIFPHTYKSLPYKPEVDLAPVALVAWSTMALAVGPAVPASVRRLSDFLDWCSAHPKQANYGSPASGSIPHLLMAAMAQARQVPLQHVAYRGSSNALQDLRGGTLPAHCGPVGVFLPHLKSGQLRLLAVSGDTRSPFVPDVPTFRELGHGLTAREWYGFFLPGRARPEVVQRAASALRGALADGDMAEGLASVGLEPARAASAGPAELAALMRADSDEWRGLIRRIGFSADS